MSHIWIIQVRRPAEKKWAPVLGGLCFGTKMGAAARARLWMNENPRAKYRAAKYRSAE